MINPYLTEKAGLLYGHIKNQLKGGHLSMFCDESQDTTVYRWLLAVTDASGHAHTLSHSYTVSGRQMSYYPGLASLGVEIGKQMRADMDAKIASTKASDFEELRREF